MLPAIYNQEILRYRYLKTVPENYQVKVKLCLGIHNIYPSSIMALINTPSHPDSHQTHDLLETSAQHCLPPITIYSHDLNVMRYRCTDTDIWCTVTKDLHWSQVKGSNLNRCYCRLLPKLTIIISLAFLLCHSWLFVFDWRSFYQFFPETVDDTFIQTESESVLLSI